MYERLQSQFQISRDEWEYAYPDPVEAMAKGTEMLAAYPESTESIVPEAGASGTSQTLSTIDNALADEEDRVREVETETERLLGQALQLVARNSPEGDDTDIGTQLGLAQSLGMGGQQEGQKVEREKTPERYVDFTFSITRYR
jgi:hypothetical protein